MSEISAGLADGSSSDYLLPEHGAVEYADTDAALDPPAWVLPEKWWDRRRKLRLIYDWAVASGAAPELLLGHVLAQVFLAAPIGLHLPPALGGPAPLNFGAVVVSPTGVGKSLTRNIGATVLHDAPRHRLRHLGSGQGIEEMLLGSDKSPEGERLPHGEPVLVYSDEGRKLHQLIEQTGSTLVANLCSAISGEPLGTTNATADLCRAIAAGSYRFVVLLNVQPVFLDGILAEDEAGLQQRFLFLYGTGHHLSLDRPHRPTEHLVIPRIDLDRSEFTTEMGKRCVDLPGWLRDEIWRAHVERLHALDRGEPVVGSSHRMLLRLRLAVGLAFIEGHYVLDDDDWDLAEAPVAASDAVLDLAAQQRAWRSKLRDEYEANRAAAHAVAADRGVAEARQQRQRARALMLIGTTPGITRKDFRQQWDAKSRPGVDDVLAELVAEGVVREVSETGQGRERVALYLSTEAPA